MVRLGARFRISDVAPRLVHNTFYNVCGILEARKTECFRRERREMNEMKHGERLAYIIEIAIKTGRLFLKQKGREAELAR